MQGNSRSVVRSQVPDCVVRLNGSRARDRIAEEAERFRSVARYARQWPEAFELKARALDDMLSRCLVQAAALLEGDNSYALVEIDLNLLDSVQVFKPRFHGIGTDTADHTRYLQSVPGTIRAHAGGHYNRDKDDQDELGKCLHDAFPSDRLLSLQPFPPGWPPKASMIVQQPRSP